MAEWLIVHPTWVSLKSPTSGGVTRIHPNECPLFLNSHWKKGCIKPHHLQLLDLSVKRLTASLLGIKVKSAIWDSTHLRLHLWESLFQHFLKTSSIWIYVQNKHPGSFFSAKSLKNDFWWPRSWSYGALYRPRPQNVLPPQTWDQAYAPFES